MKVKVYNLIILDESGSMQAIHKPAIDGLNETLQTIQSAQEAHNELQEHFVTIVFFNSNGIRTVIENKSIKQVNLLGMCDFAPTACTPLYDAMGITLSKLYYQLDREERTQVLVTVITDGCENASREYSGRMIKNLVSDLKESGWVFAYIGANQDVVAMAESLSIDNQMLFKADSKGSREMAKKICKSRSFFYNKLSQSLFDDDVDLQKDFFEDKDEKESCVNKEGGFVGRMKKPWRK